MQVRRQEVKHTSKRRALWAWSGISYRFTSYVREWALFSRRMRKTRGKLHQVAFQADNGVAETQCCQFLEQCPSQRFLGSLILSFVMGLAIAACAPGDDQGASNTTASSGITAPPSTAASQPINEDRRSINEDRRSPRGAPLGAPSGTAAGAPVKIPQIASLVEYPLNYKVNDVTVLEHIRSEFREACGGTLCVKLHIVDLGGATPTESCNYKRLDPSEGEVPRGAVVKIIVDCQE